MVMKKPEKKRILLVTIPDLASIGGQSAAELSPSGSCSAGTNGSGSSPGDVLPKNLTVAGLNQSPPTTNSAVASVQAALAALQAGQMSLNQVSIFRKTNLK